MSISITLMGKDKHYKYIGDVKGIVNFINLLEAGKTVEEAAILLFWKKNIYNFEIIK